jgi:hypothetical protein
MSAAYFCEVTGMRIVSPGVHESVKPTPGHVRPRVRGFGESAPEAPSPAAPPPEDPPPPPEANKKSEEPPKKK